MLKKAPLIILFSLIATFMTAQVDVRDSVVSAFIPHISYSFQFPGGDVAERYGNNSTLGGGVMYKTSKNYLFSLDANFLFGGNVKNADSILWMVETKNNVVIDGNGTYALYAIYERGFNMFISFGKTFKLLNVNPNTGISVMAGVGYLLHRMKIDNQHITAPQISGDYALGYDQLTGGFAFKESLSWFYMGNTRITNFSVGVEFQQAFTKSLRDWDLSTMQKDNNSYFDYFIGLKVGWMLPIYKRAPDKYYYY